MKLISNKSIIENTAIVQDDVVNYKYRNWKLY